MAHLPAASRVDAWHEAPVDYQAMTNRFNNPGYKGMYDFICAPFKHPQSHPRFVTPANFWGESYGRAPEEGGSEYRALDLYGHNSSLLKIDPSLVLQDLPVPAQMH